MNNAPSWAIGILLLAFALKELYLTYLSVFNPKKIIEKYQLIYDELETLEEKTNGVRTVLMKGHDSGKPLEGFSKLFSSVIASTSSRNELRDLTSTWQNVEVDRDYINAITEIFNNKIVRIETNKLKPNSILKDLFISDKIACTYIYIVGYKTERNMFSFFKGRDMLVTFIYIGVDFDMIPDEDSSIKESIRQSANKIKNALGL